MSDLSVKLCKSLQFLIALLTTPLSMKKILLLLLFSNTLFAQNTYHFDLLKDINPTTKDARILFIENVGDTAVFFHLDYNINTGANTLRLWKSNGTTLENFASSDLFSGEAYYSKPIIIDNYIFFHVSNNPEYGLFVANMGSSTIKKIVET